MTTCEYLNALLAEDHSSSRPAKLFHNYWRTRTVCWQICRALRELSSSQEAAFVHSGQQVQPVLAAGRVQARDYPCQASERQHELRPVVKFTVLRAYRLMGRERRARFHSQTDGLPLVLAGAPLAHSAARFFSACSCIGPRDSAAQRQRVALSESTMPSVVQPIAGGRFFLPLWRGDCARQLANELVVSGMASPRVAAYHGHIRSPWS